MRPRILALCVLAGCNEHYFSPLDNDPPVASIVNPRGDDVLLEGYVVTLRGTVTDDQSLDDITAAWFADDAEVCTGPLVGGDFVCDWQVPAADGVRLRFEAVDAHGAKDVAVLDLDIRLTEPPTIDIERPIRSGAYYANTPVLLAGTISDAEDPPEALRVTWTSDRDGPLDAAAATGAPNGSFTGLQTLSKGRHALVATVTDASGKTATDEVEIEVSGPNAAPTCDLFSPIDGQEVGHLNELVFAALVDDGEVPPDTLTVELSSDVDGVFGTPTPTLDGDVAWPWSALTLGTHHVTLTVTDDAGATCTDAVRVEVVDPPSAPVVHVAPADPQNSADLVCVVDVASVDPQGDPVTYVFEWSYDGVPFPSGVETTLPGDTVPHGFTAPGQVWECAASATDGRTTGSPGRDQVTVAIPTVASVVAGRDHACQLDSGAELECWGQSTLNQLDLSDGFYVSVGLGTAHTCGVDLSGRLQCAGYDADGQASPPFGGTWTSVDAGDAHTCAIATDGSITCFGGNVDGESDTSALAGVYTQVSSAFRHNCAVRDDGGLDCWGNDTFGRCTPTPGVTWSQVSAGRYHTCGLDQTGVPVCFGLDSSGESSPPGGTFAHVSAGESVSCGVRGTGAIECWGLDTGPGEAMAPPPGTFTQVSVGDQMACAVDTAGALICWGDDTYGECSAPPTWW